jgi:hypothetical protein
MSTIRAITDEQLQLVIVTAQPLRAVIELTIGGRHASLPSRQARMLAYAILSAAEEVDAGIQES